MVLHKLHLLVTDVPSSLAVNYARPIIVTHMCVCLFYTCAAAVQTSTRRLTAFNYIKLHILYSIIVTCTPGKLGGELDLVVWWSDKIFYSHVYIWRSHTEPPNQPPNLIPANISGYTVYPNLKIRSDLGTRLHVHVAIVMGMSMCRNVSLSGCD